MLSALCLLLTACASGGGEASWLTGFSYRWTNSNHRLSALSAAPDGPAAEVAVVGGTSTTGVVFGDDTCPLEGCGELPVEDTWDLSLAWQHARAERFELLTTRVSTDVGAGGATVSATATFSRKVRQVEAWIGSLALATGVPQELPSCYDPRHGWLPRHLRVAVGEASVDGKDVSVPVEFGFQAGLTLEDLRRCLDEAAPEARMGMEVELVLVGLRDEASADVTLVQQAQEVPFDPTIDQDPPADAATGWSPQGPLHGWRSLSWWFHEADDRGAYLRSLSFQADPEAGEAIGWATNEAPGILLQSGFDFRFEGELLSLDVEAEVETRQADEVALAADVDESGEALTWSVQGD